MSALTSPRVSGIGTTALKSLLTCGICLNWCKHPVLFGCGNHYYCASCIRSWTGNTCTINHQNKYDFHTSCPTCRYIEPNADGALRPAADALRDWSHRYVIDNEKQFCPFCSLNIDKLGDRDHVYTCKRWEFMCRRVWCNKKLNYIDLPYHDTQCGWKCSHSECHDGIGLSLQGQMEHHNEHSAVSAAIMRMNDAHRILPCSTSYLRHETVRILNHAVDQMYQLRLAPDDTESMSGSDMADEDISIDGDQLEVDGSELQTIIDSVRLQLQLEEKLTTWSSGAQDKEEWRYKWRLADDWVPRIPLGDWVTKHLHVWTLLPSVVRDRLIKRPYGPP
jgi:hypothetical protein